MVILRCLGALAGLLILMFAPEYSLEVATGAYGALATPGWTAVAATMAAIVLLSSGFFLVALAGRRIIRAAWLRTLAGILLGLPMIAGMLALLSSNRLDIMTIALTMLGCGGVLFIAFVWPAAGRAARRPMRSAIDSSFESPSVLSGSRK